MKEEKEEEEEEPKLDTPASVGFWRSLFQRPGDGDGDDDDCDGDAGGGDPGDV